MWKGVDLTTMKKVFEMPMASVKSFAAEDVITVSVINEEVNDAGQTIWWTDSWTTDNGGYDIFD